MSYSVNNCSSTSASNFEGNSSCLQPTSIVKGNNNPDVVFIHTFAFGSAIYMLLISVVTIPANSALLLVIFVDPLKTFRDSPSTYFLAGVGIADLLVGLLQEPMYAAVFIMIYTKHPNLKVVGRKMLHISRAIGNTALTAALLIILAFTITQYIVITSPLKYGRHITKRKVILAVSLIFIYSFLFWVVLYWLIAGTSVELQFELNRVDAFLHCLLLPVINIIFIILLHVAFKRKMKRSARLRSESSRQEKHERDRQNQVERKFIAVNIMLMAIIFFCSQPTAILWWLKTFLWTDVQAIAVEVNITSFMADNVLYLKCLLDPIVYAWRLPKYRQALKKVLPCLGLGLKRRSKYQGRIRATMRNSAETVVTLSMTTLSPA